LRNSLGRGLDERGKELTKLKSTSSSRISTGNKVYNKEYEVLTVKNPKIKSIDYPPNEVFGDYEDFEVDLSFSNQRVLNNIPDWSF